MNSFEGVSPGLDPNETEPELTDDEIVARNQQQTERAFQATFGTDTETADEVQQRQDQEELDDAIVARNQQINADALEATFGNGTETAEEVQQRRGQEQQDWLNNEVIPSIKEWHIDSAHMFREAVTSISQQHNMRFGDAWLLVRDHSEMELGWWEERKLRRMVQTMSYQGFFN